MLADKEYIKKFHEKMLYPIVLVTAEGAGGSGTILHCNKNEKNGEYSTYVLTNHHVIEKAIKLGTNWDSMLNKDVKDETRSTVMVSLYKYKYMSQLDTAMTVEADIVAYTKKQDMALLKLRSIQPVDYIADVYKGNSDDIHIRRDAVACGCSLLHTPLPSIGIISSMHDEIENYVYWMSSAQIIYGSSGGAMFLADTMEFIGVPSRIAISGEMFGTPITHMGYFIPIHRVLKWLEDECYQFIYDNNFNIEQCDKMRKEKKDAGRKRIEKKLILGNVISDDDEE